MKWKTFLFLLFAVSFSLFFVTCDLLNKDDDEPETLSTEEAKVEMRANSQQMIATMEAIMETPAALSLDYLAELMSDEDYKSSLNFLMLNSRDLTLTKLKDVFRDNEQSKSQTRDDLIDFGIFQFNFVTDTFELIEESDNVLQMIYPADAQAYASQLLNAVMTLQNLQYQDIEYTDTYWDEDLGMWVTETYNETVPISADVNLLIDEEEVMSGSYQSTLTEDGRPTSFNISFAMGTYQVQLGFSGSGLSYNTSMSFSFNSIEVLGFNFAMKYTDDKESVEELSGNFRKPPISLDGNINYAAMEASMEESEENEVSYDYDFLNSQMNIEVFHDELNATLGNLVLMEYIDPDTNEAEAQIAIMYEDGSWEWLSDIVISE
ncbi:MAG: hypothetical protein KAG99_09200 [Bacteroidales bacterium]|nr:hypothetical protein [Bacteroidales bacterium]